MARGACAGVICAITGVAYGGGLQVALGADLRYASPDARLSVMEIKWGIIPDMAITTTLARYMPADRVKELALTGRVVDGNEAAEMLGLVTAVHEDPGRRRRARRRRRSRPGHPTRFALSSAYSIRPGASRTPMR